MSVSNKINVNITTPSAPGYDLPSPKLTLSGKSNENIPDPTSNSNNKSTSYDNNDYASRRVSQMKTNEGGSTGFTRIRAGVSEARNSIQKRVDKAYHYEGTKILNLSVDLIAQLIQDYDRLRQDHDNLVEQLELYEQNKSTLTQEKLEEYIEIADQVIKMNEQRIEEIDRKHETLKTSRKALATRSGEDLGVQENVVLDNCGENGESVYPADVVKNDTSNHDESEMSENQRGNGVGKKIPIQCDIAENGGKQQVVGGRNKVGTNERSEENFGVGSSRTDYDAEIMKTKNNVNEKDDKANDGWDVRGSDGSNSQNWSDLVDAEFYENENWESENIDESDKWESEFRANNSDGKYDRENKNDFNIKNKRNEEEWRSGYNGNAKENKNFRGNDRPARGRYPGRNRWRPK